MRFIGNLILLLLIVLGGAGGLLLYAQEAGEVVVVTTNSPEGPADTRLWIVDHQDAQWLRAGFEGAGWYVRMKEDPNISMERGGQSADYTIVAVPEEYEKINQLMAEKYGWADQYIGAIFGRDDGIAIRLDPAS